MNEARALPPRPIPFPAFSPGFFSSLSRSMFSKNCMRNWLAWYRSQRQLPWRQRSQLTGLANHLPPPFSNQLRCPPSEVVHNTPKGLCWNSRNGIASFTAICGLLVWPREHLCCKAYWVILCVDCEKRYPHGHQRVTGGCITIVCSFGRIAPSRALKFSVIGLAPQYSFRQKSVPVKLVQVRYIPDLLDVNAGIL